MPKHEDAVYVSVFNFSKEASTIHTIPLDKPGLDFRSFYETKELWGGKSSTVAGELT